MTRAACPTFPWKICPCGFSADQSLFPDITRTWASTRLKNANTINSVSSILSGAWIYITSKDWEWDFPRWICKGVRSIVLEKLKSLWIEKPKRDLFSDLLPATWPDDESEPSIGSWGIPLVWDDDSWFPIAISRAWNPNPEQLRLDE